MGGQHGNWWGEGAWDKVSQQGAVAPGSGSPGSVSVLLQECLNAAQLLGGFVTSSGKMVVCRKSVIFNWIFYINEV